MRILNHINAKELQTKDIETIRQEVLKHGLIMLPNQFLSVDELHQFTLKIGNPIKLPRETSFGEQENIARTVVRVSNIRKDGTLITGHKGAIEWHTDSAYYAKPLNKTWNILYGEIIPKKGGETAFAYCQLAYQKLSIQQKNFLRNKKIVVDAKKIPNFYVNENFPVAEHDIIFKHPLSFKKSLYVSGPTNVITIKDQNEKDSQEIMQSLHEHILQKENLYIHSWRKGDLLIWDNLMMLHRSLGNYGDQSRLLFRTQVRII